MTTLSFLSRYTFGENSLWRRSPRLMKFLLRGILVLCALDAVIATIWLIALGGLEEIRLIQSKAKIDAQIPLTSTTVVEPEPVQKKPQPEKIQLAKYEVRSGDTLYDIALANDINLGILMAANPNLNGSARIDVGDILKIPSPDMKLEDLPQTDVSGGNGNKSSSTHNGGNNGTTSQNPPRSLAKHIQQINGVPIEKIIVLPPDVVENIRQVYKAGKKMGNDIRAFMKIGDSTIESPYFMDSFDLLPINWGEYSFLQEAIYYYQGSYCRQGPLVQDGMNVWSLFDPMWVDHEECKSGETPVACEFRTQKPAFVIIRLGSNEIGKAEQFTSMMKKTIELSLDKGIVPILGTGAERTKHDEESNEIIRKLAVEYKVPLWDFAVVAQTLPSSGISSDEVHLTDFDEYDYTLGETLQTGYGVHNLTALMMMYELWRLLIR